VLCAQLMKVYYPLAKFCPEFPCIFYSNIRGDIYLKGVVFLRPNNQYFLFIRTFYVSLSADGFLNAAASWVKKLNANNHHCCGQLKPGRQHELSSFLMIDKDFYHWVPIPPFSTPPLFLPPPRIVKVSTSTVHQWWGGGGSNM
jgi:hypothetical protein